MPRKLSGKMRCARHPVSTLRSKLTDFVQRLLDCSLALWRNHWMRRGRYFLHTLFPAPAAWRTGRCTRSMLGIAFPDVAVVGEPFGRGP